MPVAGPWPSAVPSARAGSHLIVERPDRAEIVVATTCAAAVASVILLLHFDLPLGYYDIVALIVVIVSVVAIMALTGSHPTLALVLAIVTTAVFVVTITMFAHALAAYGRTHPGRSSTAAFVIGILIVGASMLLQVDWHADPMCLIALGLGVMLAIDTTARERVHSRRRREIAAAERETALREEREHLTQQLHDGLGRRLALINLRLSAMAADRIESNSDWRKVGEEMDQTFYELRALVSNVNDHTGTIDPLRRYHDFVDDVRGLGIHVSLIEDPAIARLDPGTVEVLGLVGHEGLLNAVKHADPGEIRISMVVDRSADVVEVVVRSPTHGDRSRGPGGFGLASLSRAVEALGGQMETFASAGTFVLLARVPTRPIHGAAPAIATAR